jgi:hypothetical protein
MLWDVTVQWLYSVLNLTLVNPRISSESVSSVTSLVDVGCSHKMYSVARWYALLLTRSVNTQLVLCEAWCGAPWRYWSVVGCDGRATVVEVGWWRCCLETAGSVLALHWGSLGRRAVQWIPMNPESWSGWFPLKSSPTCSCRWLRCDLQNVPR